MWGCSEESEPKYCDVDSSCSKPNELCNVYMTGQEVGPVFITLFVMFIHVSYVV